MTEDPIRDSRNWYAYVANNPVNLVDPLGLCVEKDGFVEIAGVLYKAIYNEQAYKQARNYVKANRLAALPAFNQSFPGYVDEDGNFSVIKSTPGSKRVTHRHRIMDENTGSYYEINVYHYGRMDVIGEPREITKTEYEEAAKWDVIHSCNLSTSAFTEAYEFANLAYFGEIQYDVKEIHENLIAGLYNTGDKQLVKADFPTGKGYVKAGGLVLAINTQYSDPIYYHTAPLHYDSTTKILGVFNVGVTFGEMSIYEAFGVKENDPRMEYWPLVGKKK